MGKFKNTLNPADRGLVPQAPVIGTAPLFSNFEDFSNYEKMNRSAQDWYDVGVTLANQRANFFDDTFKSKEDVLAHGSRFGSLNDHFLELSDKYRNQFEDGSEARKSIDALTGSMSGLRDAEREYADFMGQFEDKTDYHNRYLYPMKYAKSGAADIENRITELTKSGDNSDELRWLKSNRYSYYSRDELKKREKELEQQLKQQRKQDQAEAEARIRETGMLPGEGESAEANRLRAQLAAIRNAERDLVYSAEAEKWDAEHQKIFYGQYGAWLNKIANDLQSSRVGMGDAVTGELDAARKGAAEMEDYLRSLGYTDEQLRGLRAYAQSAQNSRRAYENMKYWEGVADKGFWGKVGASVASVPANLLSGMAFLDSALHGLTNPTDAFTGSKQAVDYNTSVLAYASENMRAAVSKDMSEVGKFFYNTGMSIADFLVGRGVVKATGAVGTNIAALGKVGQGVGNAAELMLSGAAANASMRAAIERGATDAEAIGFGFLCGFAEMAGEHMSIEHLNSIERAVGKAASKRTVTNILKNVGLQAAVEGSEEGFTTLANTLSDFIVMGDRAEYNQAVENYIAEGQTQESARRHALTDWLTGLALDFAGGAISGGVTAGVTIGASVAHQKVTEAVVGWKDKSSLNYLLTIDKALSYPEGSETRKFAENLAARLDGATTLAEANIKDGEVGRLIRLMTEEAEQLDSEGSAEDRRAHNPAEAFRPAKPATKQASTETGAHDDTGAPDSAGPQHSTVGETLAEHPAESSGPVTVSETAAAFEAQGIRTESAIVRAELLDKLLAGEHLSNKQLEKIGGINDKAGRAAFTAVTGKQIPPGITAAKLRQLYRETAAELTKQNALAEGALESSAQAAAEAQIAEQLAADEETNPAAAFQPEASGFDKNGKTGYNNGRSSEVTALIDRLNKGNVPIEETMALPEIDKVERRNKEATQTIDLPNREAIQEAAYEKAMAQGSFNGKDYTGPVRQERRMDIVLGLPGSGKSSVYTERISQEQGARVIDTDDFRDYIPEYDGKNAPVVHEEASNIKKRVMTSALEAGDNIILSTIGANAEKMEREILTYTNAGYSVYLHLNELPNHKSQARALSRFFKEDGTTGRYVSPELIAEYGDKPTQTYLYLTGRSDINGVRTDTEQRTADARGETGVSGDVEADVREGRGREHRGRGRSGETISGEIGGRKSQAELAGYDWYNNDVEFGQPPILVESSDKSAKGGEVNAGNQSGVSPEDRLSLGERNDGDGDTGARLDEVSGRREGDKLVSGERPDGRGDTGLSEIVRLSENDKKSIANRGYTVVDLNDATAEPAVFVDALNAAREADTRNGWAVSPQEADDLTNRAVKLLMSDDRSCGLGVDPDGDIIGAFKHPGSGGRRVLFSMLPTAIANGGTKLDCYGSDLVWQYQYFGFIPVARVKFNPEFANPGWTPDKGQPEIYFMLHNGDSAEVSLRKALNGEYETYSQEYLDALPELDYDAASDLRNRLLDERQRRFRVKDGKVKLDDGTELDRETFAAQIRKSLPDATDAEIDAMFEDAMQSDAPLETKETVAEGHKAHEIAPETAEELAEGAQAAEHVKMDTGIKLSRGQQWLAKFLTAGLRKTGVITDVVISDKQDGADGSMLNGVLTLHPKHLTPEAVAQKIIVHEFMHALVDKLPAGENGKRNTELADYVLDAISVVDPELDLVSEVDRRTAKYKAFFAARINTATGKPYTQTEIDMLVNEGYIREEIAADAVGKVFAEQHMLNDFAGVRPGLVARAYMAASKIANLRANNSAEAKAVRRYSRDLQRQIRAALDMAGAYATENGETAARMKVADKPWAKQMELGYVALGLRNVDGYNAENYATARDELGDSCFVIKEVPAILQELGLGNKPLTYTQMHFAYATLPIERNESGRRLDSTHGIDEDVLSRLPELLSRPVMVLKSRQLSKTTGELSNALIVVVDAYDAEGTPIGVAIQPRGAATIDGMRKASNHILSVYGLEDLNSDDEGRNILRTAHEQNGFLYVNSALTDKMLRKIEQKKSAEPINSPEDTSKEYSANEAVSDAASRIPQDAKDFSLRPGKLTPANNAPKSIPLQRSTSSDNSVAQAERVVNSRYRALAENPYLKGVEFDSIIESQQNRGATVALPDSLMHSGYTADGELLRWRKNGDTWVSDENAGDSYLNMSNPLILDCEGRDASQLGEVSNGRGDSIKSIRGHVYANELKYDGIVLRNLSTDAGVADAAIALTDSQVIPIKSDESVTLDGRRYHVEEREYAPVFYSKLERVIEAQKQEKLGAASVVSMLKGKGVKAEEIKWSGVESFLDGKKSVTKAELLQFVRDNQLQIDTVRLGEESNEIIPTVQDGITFLDGNGKETDPSVTDYIVLADDNGTEFARFERDGEEWVDSDTGEIAGEDIRDYVFDQSFDYNARIKELYSDDRDDGLDTHWGQYTLSEGENYRELLYTMPDSTYSNQSMDVHWGRSGVLAHARVQDFVNAEGKSVLFVEEIQSDWHNAGQKEGYNDPAETEAEYKRLQKRVLEVNAELDTDPELAEIARKLAVLRDLDNIEYAKNRIYAAAGDDETFYVREVLNANPELRARVYPTENDEFGSATLTPDGVQQVMRDNKALIGWQEKLIRANAELREYKWAMDRGMTPDAPFRNSYTDFVLKNLLRDAAERGYDMIAWTTGAQQEARWSSEFAEGYRIEYDQDIPSFLKKYGKQWGAKVGYTLIGRDLRDSSAYRDGGMEAVMTIAANVVDESGTMAGVAHIVHSMEITDEMRRSVLYDGQPRFHLTEQSTTDSALNDMFSVDNAVRFAVSGGRTIDSYVQEILRRRREVSKVRSNTFERADFFTRTELDMEGLRPKDMQYNVVTERESMAAAQQRLEQDYEGEKAKLKNADTAWSGTDLDTAMGVLCQELTTARQSHDYKAVIEWAQRIRKQGTQAGQMIQAFAKYTRTPEGVLVRAANDLRQSTLTQSQREALLSRIAQFSETLEAIQTGDKNALIDLILKQAEQRRTPVSKKTLEAMRAETTEFRFLYDTAITQLDQIAKDYIRSSFGRKVATYQTISHLLNIRTGARNLGSNNVFSLVDTVASDAAMLPDLMLSAITGQRTVGLDRSRFSKAAREGAKAARNESRIEIALDVAPDSSKDKYGTSRRTWKMTGGKGARVMSTLEKAMGFELNYTDESAKGAIRAQVMQSLKPYVDNGTMTLEEAQQFAEDEALYRTFQDETLIGKGLGALKRALNFIGVDGGTDRSVLDTKLRTHDFGLGDIVVKYTQVPGALVTRAVEFSPLGYAKALYNMYQMFSARRELNTQLEDLTDKEVTELKTAQDRAQRRAALFIGRATTGTGLVALFAALAAAGLLHRGDDEDDPDAKSLNAAMGMAGTQLNISALGRGIAGEGTEWREGDILASLDFLEPLNSLMAMGTLVARSEDGVSVGKIAEQSLPALLNAFSELSVMQTLRTVVDTSTYYTPESGLGLENEDWDKAATIGLNVALSGATGFIPAPVRQLAQATDSFNRDAYSERDIGRRTMDQMALGIPGLRETLPIKQTGFGEPKPAESALLRAVNAFAMPGTINTYKPSTAADELADVYRLTDEANIYPNRNAPYKLTIGTGREKVDYALTAEERAEYLRTRGQLSKQLIDAARASEAYRTADEYVKAEMLVEAKNYANYVAKKDYFTSHGIDFKPNATYEGYGDMLKAGVDLSSYLAFNTASNALEADADENGDPISGTRKAKTLDLLAEQNMDSAQKAALYFKAYPDEQEKFERAGIDFDSYLTYSRGMCTMTGDKDASGKTISGSKKAKVVNLINSLNIPADAKTRLYLENGYAAKSIPSWS